MNFPHTHGPWRWEYNASHRSVHLVGGRPQFDLTVIDFSRWGMGGAVPRFRDTSVGGMNLMDRLCDRKDWIAPFDGRQHHSHWCAAVIHPDARLIAAAPSLLAALQTMTEVYSAMRETLAKKYPMDGWTAETMTIDAARAAIAEATGEQP